MTQLRPFAARLPTPQHADQPVVHLVDDDEEMRSSLAAVLQSVGIVALVYPDAPTFLSEVDIDEPAVVVLEARMRGVSGLQVQKQLVAAGCPAPIVFCSAHADVAIAVRAMRAGAADFLTKPYDSQQLLEVVQGQIPRAQQAFLWHAERRRLERALSALTPRERQVLEHVVDGCSSQEIAMRLGTSVKTIDVHRMHIRTKMAVVSLGHLVRDLLVYLPHYV